MGAQARWRSSATPVVGQERRLRRGRQAGPSYGFTYSKSTGLPCRPLAGGATQPAILPGSRTGFISDSTNSWSPSVGSHFDLFDSHSSALTIRPSGDTWAP